MTYIDNSFKKKSFCYSTYGNVSLLMEQGLLEDVGGNTLEPLSILGHIMLLVHSRLLYCASCCILEAKALE